MKPLARKYDPQSAQTKKDVAVAMVGLGIPDMFQMVLALKEGRREDALYYAQIMGTSHLIWYTAWKLVEQWDLFRHAGKNVRGMTFHGAMQGRSALAGQIFKSVAPLAAIIESTYYQREVWQNIGDEKTGAIHYSGAGDIGSGGSMPVVPELESFSWRSIKREFGFD